MSDCLGLCYRSDINYLNENCNFSCVPAVCFDNTADEHSLLFGETICIQRWTVTLVGYQIILDGFVIFYLHNLLVFTLAL